MFSWSSASADSTLETLYQCGSVHDPTAAMHTFQCCHPSDSRDLQPQKITFKEEEKHQCLPPGWSQHSSLRVIFCLPFVRGNYIPFGTRREISISPGMTGCYQKIRGNAVQMMLLQFSLCETCCISDFVVLINQSITTHNNRRHEQ